MARVVDEAWMPTNCATVQRPDVERSSQCPPDSHMGQWTLHGGGCHLEPACENRTMCNTGQTTEALPCLSSREVCQRLRRKSRRDPFNYLPLAVLVSFGAPPCGLLAIYFELRVRRAMHEDRADDAWRYSTNALICCLAGFALIGLCIVLLTVAHALLRSGVIQLNKDTSPPVDMTPVHVLSTEWNGTTVYPKMKPESVFTVCIIMC